MAKYLVIGTCHVGALYHGGNVADLNTAQQEMVKVKKMTHHFQPLDVKDAWEVAEKDLAKSDLTKKKVEDLRGIAVERNIEIEGLSKEDLIAALTAKA
jgi:hypothetical protein